ncbi:MAG: type VI secretion system tip protein VgrG, partial [Paracoccaceae bacterium]
TVKLGNITIDANLGKIAMTAMQEITLTVGGSSIKIDQMGVTITGAMSVKIDAKLQAEISSLMTKVDGSAMTTISGGLVMIN